MSDTMEWEPTVAIADDEPDADADGLGAAVLPEFPDAVGIETLAEQAPKRRRAARETEPEPPTAALSEDVLRQAFHQLDHTVSVVLRIEREDDEYMDKVADGVLPLANHFAAKSESVVALAVFAGLSVLSYAVVKYQRFLERNAQHGTTESE